MALPKSNRIFLYLSLVLALPVYWATVNWMERSQVGEPESVAFAATLAFLLLLYLGWSVPDSRSVLTKDHFRQKMITWVAVAVMSFLVLTIRAGVQLAILPFIFLGLATGILFRSFFARLEQRLREAERAAAQSRSELQLLQSQLSPHFLFNTLNSLYGLSINDHRKVPALLLKLSDLLRYSVYEVKDLFVPLDSEIAYIQNYIDFEKLRIGERLQLQADIGPVTDGNIRIAPMLLIVFIENAFKHAKNTHRKTIVIEISLQIWEDRILFAVKNSYEEQPGKKPGIHSGLGLDNTSKRLKALYPDQHQLQIEKKDHQYSVTLQLPAK